MPDTTAPTSIGLLIYSLQIHSPRPENSGCFSRQLRPEALRHDATGRSKNRFDPNYKNHTIPRLHGEKSFSPKIRAVFPDSIWPRQLRADFVPVNSHHCERLAMVTTFWAHWLVPTAGKQF
jgi:hypothetical protein